MAGFGKDPSKTEPPTAKRRSEARTQGQVAKSKEIHNVVILFAGLAALSWFGSELFEGISGFMSHTFSRLHQTTETVQGMYAFALFVANISGRILAPIILILMVAGVVSNLAQTGWIFSAERLQPKLPNIDPLKGLQRMVSMNGVVELIKSVIKMVVIGGVAYLVIKKELKLIPYVLDMSAPAMAMYIVGVGAKLVFYVGLIMIVIAILDFAYQKWEHEESLKMTKEEVKDEAKQREGDPQIKAKQRSKQREVATRRMMQEVPKADVVITNPTFLAIAIQYAPEAMKAPKVVAKGARLIAEKIRDIAKEHGIPIYQDPPLAQALFKSAEVGDEIPADLYRAVAEVLAYVYRLKGKAA